jgi:peptide-methionine (R)-S-oxide reductase
MHKLNVWFFLLLAGVTSQHCSFSQSSPQKQIKTMENPASQNPYYDRSDRKKLEVKEEEWKKVLPPDVFYVARQKGTERPWTSKFENFYEQGTYHCAACGNMLFRSSTKFDSGCGWPSFFEPVSKASIIYTPDNTLGMNRTEVQCGRCKAHLGHVFEDGPPPTGLRYCINGVVLDFDKARK